MENRYGNIDGTRRISETYTQITEGFNRVQQDVDAGSQKAEVIHADIKNHKASESAHAAEHITYVGPIAGAEDLKSAVDSVKQQLDTAVMAGDSGAAAAQAAIDVDGVDHRNLKVRIDSDVTKLNTQLAETGQEIHELEQSTTASLSTIQANKADKVEVNTLANAKAAKDEVRFITVPIGLSDLSAALLAAIQGGTAVNVLSEPRLKSVTPIKTSFLGQGKNLFNYRAVTVGMIPNLTTGVLESFSGSNTSEFIYVTPSTYYRFKLASGRVAFYDADQHFISGTSTDALSAIVTPASAVFMRFSVQDSLLKTQQLEAGTTSTTYEPYYVLSRQMAQPVFNFNDVEIVYENGNVTQVIEKKQGVTVKTTTVTYLNGAINTVTEVYDNTKVINTVAKANGLITGITKSFETI